MPQFPYKILQNEKFGRYMAASRKIKQGELILKEEPTLIGSQLDGPLACFRCFRNISTDVVKFCTGCKTAIVCNPQCSGKFHSFEECESIEDLNLNGNSIANNDQVIFALRCLLLRKYKPDIFGKINQLEHHLAARKNKSIYRRYAIQVEQVLFKMNMLEPTDVQNELVQKICGILDVNTFEIRPPNNIPVTNPERQCLRGLYLEAALMAHNCQGNTLISVDNNFVITIYASVEINENVPIFNNYASVLQGTIERRQHLREGKYFECNCDRCQDPTEFMTDISSLKCYKCKFGIIRPPPSNKIGELDWECNKCIYKFQPKLIELITNEGRRLIETVDAANWQVQENLLKKLISTFHSNHFLVLEVMQNLVALYNNMRRTQSNLIRKSELCKHMLTVFSQLEPGISRIRAITMYELQSAVVDLSHKQFKDKEISVEELMIRLNSAQAILKEAVRFLLYEPANSPEGQIARVAMSQLKMLQLSLKNIQSDLCSRGQEKITVTGRENFEPGRNKLTFQPLEGRKKLQENNKKGNRKIDGK